MWFMHGERMWMVFDVADVRGQVRCWGAERVVYCGRDGMADIGRVVSFVAMSVRLS